MGTKIQDHLEKTRQIKAPDSDKISVTGSENYTYKEQIL
jgi:hypothetical protein